MDLSADVIMKNFMSLSLLAVLDAFIAISEDLNLKFSWGNMPPDPPSLLTLTHLHYPLHLKICYAGLVLVY